MDRQIGTILLIEDNLPDVRLIQEMLRGVSETTFKLEHRGTLSSGIERLASGRVEAVLLDLSLPDSKGIETFLRVNESAPEVPIVVLTGVDDKALAVKTVQAGAQDYLVKGEVNGALLIRSILYARERERMRKERSHLLSSERAARSEAEKARGRLEFLARVSEALVSSIEYEEILANLTDLIVPHFADFCSIDMIKGPSFMPGVALRHSNPESEAVAREVLRLFSTRLDDPRGSARVALTGKPEFVAEVSDAAVEGLAYDGDHLEALRRLGLKSYICQPLEAGGKALGAMMLAFGESGRRYTAGDRELAEEVARRTALAMQNAQLYSEVKSANQRKNEFLAMLAHELRNPLAAIRSAVEVLCRASGEGDEAARRAALEAIKRQTLHQTKIVEDLTNVSRLIHGKLQVRLEPLDVVKLVHDVLRDHREALVQGGLRLNLEAPQGPLWVRGDTVRLSQVLVNLLHNANKFTERGGQLTVRVASESGLSRAAVTVKDTGVGIDREMLSHVFEAFMQAERSLSRTKGGLGLGLALVKGVVDLHGGEVRIHSDGEGLGCEVTFWLPLVSEGAAREPADPDPGARLKPFRVLIVEDNRDAAESLRYLLELGGHEVQVAYSGPAGMEAARRFKPQVVLCDVGLPQMDGYAVAQGLRSENATRGALLVAISGYGLEQDKKRARQAGFDHHLTKPVEPRELERILAAHAP